MFSPNWTMLFLLLMLLLHGICSTLSILLPSPYTSYTGDISPSHSFSPLFSWTDEQTDVQRKRKHAAYFAYSAVKWISHDSLFLLSTSRYIFITIIIIANESETYRWLNYGRRACWGTLFTTGNQRELPTRAPSTHAYHINSAGYPIGFGGQWPALAKGRWLAFDMQSAKGRSGGLLSCLGSLV